MKEFKFSLMRLLRRFLWCCSCPASVPATKRVDTPHVWGPPASSLHYSTAACQPNHQAPSTWPWESEIDGRSMNKKKFQNLRPPAIKDLNFGITHLLNDVVLPGSTVPRCWSRLISSPHWLICRSEFINSSRTFSCRTSLSAIFVRSRSAGNRKQKYRISEKAWNSIPRHKNATFQGSPTFVPRWSSFCTNLLNFSVRDKSFKLSKYRI